MLKEAKKALRVTSPLYDTEIAALLMAGASDLELAGVILPGVVTFTIGTSDAVTDNSTLTDPLAMRAVITYAAARFGNPPNYKDLKASYDEQKAQLAHNSRYTDYGVVATLEVLNGTDIGEVAADAEG